MKARLKVLKTYGPKRLKVFTVKEAAAKIYAFEVKHNIHLNINRMVDVMKLNNYLIVK